MENLLETRETYRRRLVEDELPFWLEHGMDRIHGGIYTCLDRDGSLLDTDKSVWFQGRALWVFSHAYNTIERRPEYLEASESLVRFIEKYCFDEDGRMFFRVTEDGKGVQKRIRYFFSECFAIIGFAEYSIASGDKSYREKALKLFENVERIRTTDGILTPKFSKETRDTRAFAGPMILINVLSNLRRAYPEKSDWITTYIHKMIDEIRTYFWKPELGCVLEEVKADGTLNTEHLEGRIVNPGHAIEGSWFIMDEAVEENDRDMMKLGLDILDSLWALGWDEEYGGGIIQYRDALGKSLSEYHHGMKFWWPQCEAMIASLMAYRETGNERYLQNFRKVEKYVEDRFIDSEYGEWFGYFYRDGQRSTDLKGNIYKGPFHIPRMYMKCIEIIDSMEN